jgi:hypothetical protein
VIIMKFKHYFFIFLTVCFAVILSISGLALLVGMKEPEVIVEQPGKYQITLECQKIASQATNEDWGYANCLKELEDSIDNLKIRLN